MARSGDGTPPGGVETSEAVWKRVEYEHRKIVALLTDLGEAKGPDRILEIANELGGILPGHFSNEEGPRGFFEEIRMLRPDMDRFLSPMEPGLKEIFGRFRRVMTVEINYSDDPGDPLIDDESRRYSQLAWLLRSKTLADVDCWSQVPGQPLPPGMIEAAIRGRLGAPGPAAVV